MRSSPVQLIKMAMQTNGAMLRAKCRLSTVIAGVLFLGWQPCATAGDGLSPRDYRDVFGITWSGELHSNLQFAKQMGYDYVMYKRGMETDELASDLGFYLESPQYPAYPVPRSINLARTYSAGDRELYEKYFAKKDGQPFPTNMATGWFSSPMVFSVEPDYQNQEVIDFRFFRNSLGNFHWTF